MKSKKTTIEETFWIVARLDGLGCSPKVRHTAWQEASDEAQRLARKESPVEFFVMRAIDSYRTPQSIPLERKAYSEKE